VFKDVNACFACGKLNEHGLKLDIRPTASGVEVNFAFAERFQGWQGVVHGGLIATILDELMAWACKTSARAAVTAEMTVRFRRPLRTGQSFRGEGRVIADRGRLLFCESRLLDPDSGTIAEATGKMMVQESSQVS
jgi:uncharacterized protein (TIGR00369 family)